jgi:predicted secreted protein
MKKFAIFMIASCFATIVHASVQLEPLLNRVTLQLQSQQWVTTKTALVNVGINAAVADQRIDKVQNDVLLKLNQLSKGEWHIVSFNRQQDKSGFENIQVVAQARLAQSELANLRDKAKAISKPGETFTIDNVAFTPSDDEIKLANTQLRNDIYQQAKAEVDALNKVYPDQKYYLRQIDFNSAVEPEPRNPNMMYMAKGVAVAAAASAPPPLSVGNKVQVQATVIIAAMPSYVLQKLTPQNIL